MVVQPMQNADSNAALSGKDSEAEVTSVLAARLLLALLRYVAVCRQWSIG
jgi:hypothetical protein